jgi:hypothetical protein
MKSRLIVGAAAVALLAVTSASALPGRAAVVAVPTVIHDVKTASLKLPSYNPTAAEADYSQPDTQIEPSIAVNPANPLNVVTVYQEGRIDSGGDITNGYATSFDGGLTWSYGELPGLTNVASQGGPFDRASDAVVAFGPDNMAYANSLVFDIASDQGLRSGMAVNVSKDGGRTWSKPVFFQDDLIGGTNDKNWVVVDNSDAAGHHKGRVYVVWDRIAPIVYDYCDANCDQLSNWLPNLQIIPGIVFPGQGIGAIPLVLTDGSLGIVMNITGAVPIPSNPTDQPDFSAGGSEVSMIRAPLAGTEPYPAPLVFLPPVGIASNQTNNVAAQRAGSLPMADVDPVSGTVYATWEDARLRTDRAASGPNDVMLSTSTDNGLHWTPAQRINPGPENDHVDRYNPTVAVGAGGVLHAMYRQRLESGTAPRLPAAIDTYYQQSHDSGKTWSTPLRVDSVPSNAYYGAFSRGGTFEGDYDQIASSGGYTYITRCQAEQAYPGEPVALTPDPATAGALTLATAGRGHQHQHTWVALVRDVVPATVEPSQPAPSPSSGIAGATALANTSRAAGAAGPAAAIALVALLGGLVLLGRRRRHS